MNRWLGGLVLLALWAAPLQAQVPTRVLVEGSCPNEEQTQISLRGLIAEPAAEAWELRVRGGEPDEEQRASAQLELVDPRGELVLRRELPRALCPDLAEAFAVIVHAHFLDLHLVSEDARDQPGDEAELEAQPEPDPEREPEPEPEPEPPEPEDEVAASFLSIGLLGGMGAGFDPSALLVRGGLELEWRQAPFGWALRMELEALRPATQSDATVGDVDFFGGGVRLVLGGRFAMLGPHAEHWLGIGAELGVGMVRVRAVELDASTIRATAAAGVVAELGLVFDRFYFRFAVHADVLPFGDNYRVEPVGNVARSSSVQVYATVGLGLTFGL